MNSRLKKVLNRLSEGLAVLTIILTAVVILGGAIFLVITFWDSFLNGFCKVSFVCWNGNPNWLGWILVGLLGVLLGVICFLLWISLLKAIMKEAEIWGQ
jgi:drug/metabolite transporter (DMT)-like permease